MVEVVNEGGAKGGTRVAFWEVNNTAHGEIKSHYISRSSMVYRLRSDAPEGEGLSENRGGIGLLPKNNWLGNLPSIQRRIARKKKLEGGIKGGKKMTRMNT